MFCANGLVGVKNYKSLYQRQEEMSDTTGQPPIEMTFKNKYKEFADDLLQVFPELEAAIKAAVALSPEESIKQYASTVFMKHTKPSEDHACPGPVLPGVVITEELWSSVSMKTKAAVYDYLSILNLSVMYTNITEDSEMSKEWAANVMKSWRNRLSKVDFDSLADKFKGLFGGDGGVLPNLPEKFLKGKLAKLAEDIVKEFKPEDFGLRPEDLAAVEKDPTRAFEILMQASTSRPELLQKAMMRVGKRLQEKIQRGELRPQDLASEAEDLMKEFQSNPAFMEMMESFRSAFSFEDPDIARAAGKDEQGRLSQVRNRLRKKLEAKKAAAAKK